MPPKKEKKNSSHLILTGDSIHYKLRGLCNSEGEIKFFIRDPIHYELFEPPQTQIMIDAMGYAFVL